MNVHKILIHVPIARESALILKDTLFVAVATLLNKDCGLIMEKKKDAARLRLQVGKAFVQNLLIFYQENKVTAIFVLHFKSTSL